MNDIDRRALSSAEPEALLLLRARDGDAGAFALLARQLARPALSQAVRILGDHALAEDAVQEALARLWREAGRFDPERGSFGGWWRRMLMNCALDARRRVRVVQPLDTIAEQADSAPDPAQSAESSEIAARVQAAAQSLPARQRAALAMFHGEGQSMAEIADILETSEKAVEGLLLRARATLREKLQNLRGMGR